MERENGDAGYQSFVKVTEQGSDDFMELPREKDGTVLLSTVQAQYPSAIGLKYKSASGGWRGIRAEDNVLDPPFGGWGENLYFITQSDALKGKSSNQENNGRVERSKRSSSNLLQDIIVLGLPYTTTEEELNEYFANSCGELAFYELKYDRDTNKSRGFGFIRFKNEEHAKEALNGHHEIQGRKLEIRLSKKKDNPMKLFVGRLAGGTTQEDVNEYFTEFGELTDVFVPNPFRGFGFVTYAEQADAMKVLRMRHVLQGANVNVTPAEPKEGKGSGRQENYGVPNTNYNLNSNSNGEQGNKWNSSYQQSTRYDPRNTQESPPAQKDVASELKDMLLTLINNQKQKNTSTV